MATALRPGCELRHTVPLHFANGALDIARRPSLAGYQMIGSGRLHIRLRTQPIYA